MEKRDRLPNAIAKIVLSSIEQILRIWIEPRTPMVQYGFMTSRSPSTALFQTLSEIKRKKGNRHVIEFDLNPFFNNVSVSRTMNSLG